MQLSATEQQWFNMIQEARSSGLSDREWCIQNHVPMSTFYYRIQRLRNKAADLPAARSTVAPEFHEVVKVEILDDDELPASAYQKAPTIVQSEPVIEPDTDTSNRNVFSARLQIDRFTVDISNSAAEETIRFIVKALRQPC